MKLLLISAITISVVTIAYVMTPSKSTSNMTPKQKILKAMYPFIMKMGSKKTKTMTEENIQNTTVDFYSLKIELNDGTIIITGGILKLKLKMIGLNFDQEINKLKQVQSFLKTQGIIDRAGLID